jgi:hypothetical protein
LTYAKKVGRPDGDGGRDKDDDILVSFTSFGIGDSFTWKYTDIPQHSIVIVKNILIKAEFLTLCRMQFMFKDWKVLCKYA